MSPEEWLVLTSILPLRLCDLRDICFMCGLKLRDAERTVGLLEPLGLVKVEGFNVKVTEACLKLALGALSKSKVRWWLLAECLDGFQDTLRSMGFIGWGRVLFTPLLKPLINTVSSWCTTIAACTSKKLSEAWSRAVGGLTPWASLNSCIEARSRALKALRELRRKQLPEAYRASLNKLVEAYSIAKNLNPKPNTQQALKQLREDLKVDLKLSEAEVTREPIHALRELDEAIEHCKKMIQEAAERGLESHPRFRDLEPPTPTRS